MKIKWPEHYGNPNWLIHDRFGMFIHWGLYSLNAKDEWIMTMDKIEKEDYAKYFKQMEADLLEPEEWVKSAKDSGMKYIILTTKHHEGFALWNTKYSEYKITNTAYGKDVIDQFTKACHKYDMKIGLYHSLIDWHHKEFPVDGLHPERDNLDKRDEDRDMSVYRDYLFGQIEELVTGYGKIDYFWFDFSYGNREWDWSKGKGPDDWHSEELERLILKHQPDILFNDRLGLERGVHTPEQFQPKGTLFNEDGEKIVWEACQTSNGVWGYNPNNLNYKTPEMIIKMLIDTVSKNGNLLMNFAPTARGNFDDYSIETMNSIGQWMKYNGKAIYGCGNADIAAPQDCRLTRNEDRLYIHIFSWPFRTLHLEEMTYDVEFARFLHDHSEIPVLRHNPEDRIHHDVPAIEENEIVLELPVIAPKTIVPVIEIKLTEK